MFAFLRRRLVSLALVAAAFIPTFSIARPAVARERLAVLVVMEGDRELSQNLTEVTIARLAQTRDFELVGMRELDQSLGEIETVQSEGLSVCVANPPCLAEVGSRAGAERAVVGSVRRDGANYVLELALVRTSSSEKVTSARAEVPAELDRLIGAVESAALSLFEAPSAAPVSPASAASAAPVPGSAAAPAPEPPPAGTAPPTRDEATARDTRFTTYLGFGAAGLAVVAFSVAAVTGSIATAPPNGDTRKERQDDLARRENYATAANVSLAVGGTLTAVAVASFVWP